MAFPHFSKLLLQKSLQNNEAFCMHIFYVLRYIQLVNANDSDKIGHSIPNGDSFRLALPKHKCQRALDWLDDKSIKGRAWNRLVCALSAVCSLISIRYHLW